MTFPMGQLGLMPWGGTIKPFWEWLGHRHSPKKESMTTQEDKTPLSGAPSPEDFCKLLSNLIPLTALQGDLKHITSS